MKCPLVLYGCMLEVVDKIQETLSFNGAMGFVANVELWMVQDDIRPARSGFCKIFWIG